MDLYLFRHAEAGKRIPAPARDIERSLTAEGKEELEDVARSLARLKIRPDHIVSSPLKRTRETADTVAKALKQRGKVEIWDELKPEGSKLELFKRLSKLKPESTVLCVGHEPYLSQAINEVMGHQGPPRILLRKCGLARLSVKGFNPKVEGELRWLLTPRLLKRMS
jgi:phosphohistidine phosphatase